MPRQSVIRKGILLVIVPVLFNIIFVLVIAQTLKQAQQDSDRISAAKQQVLVMHTWDVAVNRAIFSVLETTNEPNARNIESLGQMESKLLKEKETLQRDAQLADLNQEWLTQANDILNRVIVVCQNALELCREDETDRLGNLKALRPQIYVLFLRQTPLKQQLIETNKRVHALNPKLPEKFHLTVALLVGGLFSNIAISLLLVHSFTKDFVGRLHLIAENATKLAMQKLFVNTLTETEDEISELNRLLSAAQTTLTEIRQREIAVLDQADDVIASLDKRYRLVRIGRAATKLWHYSEDELLGQSLLSMVTPESSEYTRQQLEAAANSSIECEFENVFKSKDGSLKDTLWSVSWAPESQSYSCVAHDISERRSVERLKQNLASVVGSDLKSSLTTIESDIARIKSGAFGDLEAPVINHFAKAERGIERILDLVRDLLDLETMDAGVMVIQKSKLLASEAFAQAVEALEAFAKANKIVIVQPSGDAEIEADQRKLVQALVNILSNAIKFSPKDSTVELSIDQKDNCILLSVTDQGPGVPEEDQTVIFEKYRQSKAVSDSNLKSTGLGLAIVKAIAEAHGGTVGLQSQEGVGSRFWISLPAPNRNEAEQ